MPDDAAALTGIASFQKALDRQLDCAELLVASHYLNSLAPIIRREQCEGADKVKQVIAIQHPRHQPLLIVGAAGAMLQIIYRARIGIRPSVEVLLAVSGDGAELSFIAAGGDNDLVVVEQRRAAFALGAALLAVAEDLVDGLWDGIIDFGRLALDNYDRQTVQEKDDIRDDVVFST